MSELIDTTQMYLRTVYELREEGTPPLRARIAERLDQSGPTVSQTVGRMERDGLLLVGDDRVIQLTIGGAAAAARVMRKHRLAECMLVRLLGLDWDLTHSEACRWEHVISEDVERCIFAALGGPTESPFGKPIPALAELDPEAGFPSGASSDEVPLAEVAASELRDVLVVSIDESAQADTRLLSALRRAGVRPNALVHCRRAEDGVLIGSGGEYVEIDLSIAAHILVQPNTAGG